MFMYSKRNQRRATKQEARELDEEMESRLNAANANLQIQVHYIYQYTDSMCVYVCVSKGCISSS